MKGIRIANAEAETCWDRTRKILSWGWRLLFFDTGVASWPPCPRPWVLFRGGSTWLTGWKLRKYEDVRSCGSRGAVWSHCAPMQWLSFFASPSPWLVCCYVRGGADLPACGLSDVTCRSLPACLLSGSPRRGDKIDCSRVAGFGVVF